ncbi:MAG: N-acetyl-gamma-glutamyl-phosphate reductase [Firmicutes bacterium]|nr:N-acetyl-gamma-glutamyl-phosphate reductase [Bacillota bacterium]
MKKVFIDGAAGTVGLQLAERLQNRNDIEIISLPAELLKDKDARKEMINKADIVFLCLPDDAAREAVSMCENPETVIIDASTAHRTAAGWAYGLPELGEEFAEGIKNSKRIANPGCHASGFIALIYPLVKAGIIAADADISCFSLTGYSGGGRNMIDEYESENRSILLDAPRLYGLSQQHKHLKEMKHICGLENAPIFMPVVGDFYSGMEVIIPIANKNADKSLKNEIEAIYSNAYKSGLISCDTDSSEGAFLSAAAFAKKDFMRIRVEGNEERILLIARYDNLGKGASGAAVQCMNIVLGLPWETGLNI